jgi:hypothetical protein
LLLVQAVRISSVDGSPCFGLYREKTLETGGFRMSTQYHSAEGQTGSAGSAADGTGEGVRSPIPADTE